MDAIKLRQRARFTLAPAFPGAEPDNRPGDLLTMADGSRWFHAYSGAAPVRIEAANVSGLTIEGNA